MRDAEIVKSSQGTQGVRVLARGLRPSSSEDALDGATFRACLARGAVDCCLLVGRDRLTVGLVLRPGADLLCACHVITS